LKKDWKKLKINKLSKKYSMNKTTTLICLLGFSFGVNQANAQTTSNTNKDTQLPDKSKVLTAKDIQPITNPVIVLPALKPVEMKTNPYVGKYVIPASDIPTGAIPSTIDPNIHGKAIHGRYKTNYYEC
jgi:hypothetical protein